MMFTHERVCSVQVQILHLIRNHRYEEMHVLADEFAVFDSVAPLLAAHEANTCT